MILVIFNFSVTTFSGLMLGEVQLLLKNEFHCIISCVLKTFAIHSKSGEEIFYSFCADISLIL